LAAIAMTPATDLSEIDLTDLGNFADGFPHDLFELHRRQSPVWWHEPTENTPDGEGFWSVAAYDDVRTVLRNPVTYSSQTGGERPYGGTLLQDMPIAGHVLNMMDDPRHQQIRKLVSSGLTPRMIARVEDDLRSRCRQLIAGIVDGTEFDFVRVVATELPMQMICVLLGVPATDSHWLFEAVEPLFDVRGDRKLTDGPDEDEQRAHARMYEYGTALIAEKRSSPTEDMFSTVVNATVPSAGRLDEFELYVFFSLLFSAGAETTRNAIAGGLLALTQHPDQLAALRSEPALLPKAVEEIVRWTSPSPAKRRTATVPTTLGGHDIGAGQKVLIWEGSANRDETAFAAADRFDVTRDPNPHLGFGHGIHFCLGAGLARLEMRVLFEELLPTFTDYRVTQPVEWTRSYRHTGMRKMLVALGR
jgi:cytochrome P450